MQHARRRRPVEAQPRGEVVGLRAEQHLEHERVVVVGRVALVAAEHVQEQPLGVVAVGDPARITIRVGVVEGDLEARGGGEVEVAADGVPLAALRGDDPLLPAPLAGDEVVDVARAAPDGEVVALEVAVAEPVAALGAARLARAVVDAERLRTGRAHVVHALPDGEVHLRTSARPPLREHLDDAAGGLRPVEGRGGWPLDDLDAEDVVRVDVVEGRRRLVRLGVGTEGAVRDAHAVDVDERGVPLRDRVDAAQADRRAPRRPGRSCP